MSVLPWQIRLDALEKQAHAVPFFREKNAFKRIRKMEARESIEEEKESGEPLSSVKDSEDGLSIGVLGNLSPVKELSEAPIETKEIKEPLSELVTPQKGKAPIEKRIFEALDKKFNLSAVATSETLAPPRRKGLTDSMQEALVNSAQKAKNIVSSLFSRSSQKQAPASEVKALSFSPSPVSPAPAEVKAVQAALPVEVKAALPAEAEVEVKTKPETLIERKSTLNPAAPAFVPQGEIKMAPVALSGALLAAPSMDASVPALSLMPLGRSSSTLSEKIGELSSPTPKPKKPISNVSPVSGPDMDAEASNLEVKSEDHLSLENILGKQPKSKIPGGTKLQLVITHNGKITERRTVSKEELLSQKNASLFRKGDLRSITEYGQSIPWGRGSNKPYVAYFTKA